MEVPCVIMAAASESTSIKPHLFLIQLSFSRSELYMWILSALRKESVHPNLPLPCLKIPGNSLNMFRSDGL